jgi:hypothetical protein
MNGATGQAIQKGGRRVRTGVLSQRASPWVVALTLWHNARAQHRMGSHGPAGALRPRRTAQIHGEETNMVKKPDRMEADTKKQLEAVGHEFGVTKFFYPAGAYDYAVGKATLQNLIFPTKLCNDAELLDVSGASSTGADGKRVLLLSDFVCLRSAGWIEEPINVLATPRSERPFFLTITRALSDPARDLQITVFAWNANGQAAPNVAFDWRCRVVWAPAF